VLSTLIYAWFPEGERPSLPVTGAWDSIKLLGAVSDSGETFFLPCAENFNSDTTIRLLDALQTEFGEKSASSWTTPRISRPMQCRNSSKTHRSNCVIFRGVHQS